jgi:hypothetical protein
VDRRKVSLVPERDEVPDFLPILLYSRSVYVDYICTINLMYILATLLRNTHLPRSK